MIDEQDFPKRTEDGSERITDGRDEIHCVRVRTPRAGGGAGTSRADAPYRPGRNTLRPSRVRRPLTDEE